MLRFVICEFQDGVGLCVGFAQKIAPFWGFGQIERGWQEQVGKTAKNHFKVSVKSKVSENIYISTTFADLRVFGVWRSIFRLFSTVFLFWSAPKNKEGVGSGRGLVSASKSTGGGVAPTPSPPLYILQTRFTHHFQNSTSFL